jgi:hypothetical protein
MTIQILYINFYSILQHISAAYFSHHQAGILVHKKSKRGWPLLTNSGYKIIVKFIIIILNRE